MSGDARVFNNVETPVVIKFFSPAKQGAEGNSCYSDKKKLGKIHHRMPPSKTGWPSLNVVIFLPVMRLILNDPKQ